MNWRKFILQEDQVWLVSSITIFFIITGLAVGSTFFFFISILFAVFLLLNYFYDKYSGQSLLLKNERRRYHFFMGDEGKLELHFENNGLPIMNGRLVVQFNKNLSPTPLKDKPKGFLEEVMSRQVEVPFTIKRGENLKVTIPFYAIQRGYGRITKIEVHYSNLFAFSKISLEYSAIWREEFIVYPEIKKIDRIQWNAILKEGYQQSTSSLFEDRLLTVGTRDYLPTDSFQSIHWKASAKMNRLQTKVFEKVTDSSVTVLINVAEGFWWNENIEEIISRVAYLAELAYKENIPIAVFSNIKAYGEFPFLHIPLGEGKKQFVRILEMLAVMDTHQMIVPYEQLLHFISRNRAFSPSTIHMGLLNDAQSNLLKELSQKGTNMYAMEIKGAFSEVKKM